MPGAGAVHLIIPGRRAAASPEPICGRPPSRKACSAKMTFWSIAVICPAFVCGTEGRWPRWGSRIGSQTFPVMSKHQWVPRVVPILGPTDRHLAAVLASAGMRVSASCVRQVVQIDPRRLASSAAKPVSLFDRHRFSVPTWRREERRAQPRSRLAEAQRRPPPKARSAYPGAAPGNDSRFAEFRVKLPTGVERQFRRYRP